MNTINITTELCQEDRARIDKVIELLTLSTGQRCQSCADAVQQAFAETQPVEFTKEAELAEEKPAEAAQEAEMAPQVTKADIQQKVITLSAAGKKAQVREIVTAVATKVSDIPEDKLAEVWAKLTGLEG